MFCWKTAKMGEGRTFAPCCILGQLTFHHVWNSCIDNFPLPSLSICLKSVSESPVEKPPGCN